MRRQEENSAGRTRFPGRLGWLLLAACISRAARPGEEPIQRFQFAGSLYRAGLPEAAEEYRRFLKEFGKTAWAPEAQLMIGEAYFRQDPASPRALEHFRDAAKDGDGLGPSAALRQAEVLYNQGKYAEALQKFLDTQKTHIKSVFLPEAILGEGICRLALGEWEKARETLEGLVGLAPAYREDDRWLYAVGVAAYQVGRDSEAITALRLAPATAPALFYLARAYIRSGSPLLAVEKLKELIQNHPESEFAQEAEFLLGEAFLAARDYLSAISSYEKFLRQYPGTSLKPAAVFRIGVAHYHLQNDLQARSSFQSVLQEFSQSEFAPPALYLIGESFRRQRRLQDAAFAYSDLIRSYPGHELAPISYLLLALSRLESDPGQPAQARATLLEFSQKYLDHELFPAGQMLLGNAMSREEDFGSAARAYQAAHDRGPETELGEAAMALMCRANYRNRDYDALISAYHYLLNRLPETDSEYRPATLLYIGEGYLARGLHEKALEIFRAAASQQPASPLVPYALDGIAWAHFLAGDDEKAHLARQKLADYGRRWDLPEVISRRNPYETANALFNRKKYLEALSLYQSFAASHPTDPAASEAKYREALAYYRMEYYGQAIDLWEQLEKDYPDSEAAPRAAWQVADTYFRARKYDSAIAAYERILSRYAKEDEERALVSLRIAQSHYNAKQLSLAVPAFEAVVRNHPKTEQAKEALEFLASLLADPAARGAAAGALEGIGQALSPSPLGTEARFRLAEDHYERKEYEEAARLLERIVADLMAGSRLADSQFFLAESYHQIGRFAEAALAYGRFVTNFPADERVALARFRLASSHFKAEEFGKAGDAFLELARAHPDGEYAAAALYNAGLSFKRAQRWEEAISALSLYRQKFPDKAYAEGVPEEIAGLYEQQRNFRAAIAALEEARQPHKPDSQKWLELTVRIAENHLSGGDAVRGLELLKAASASPLKTAAVRLTALARLGEILEREGRHEEAVAAYRDLAAHATKAEWIAAAKARIEALTAKQP